MRIDVFKILTAVFSVLVIEPSPSIQLPTGLYVFSALVYGIKGILVFALFFGSFTYLVISVINQYSSKLDAWLTIASILLFFIYFSFQIIDLFKFGSGLVFGTFFCFLIFSVITLVLTINRSFINQALQPKTSLDTDYNR